MGLKERRKREAEQLRNKIIETAISLFVKDGYANVSLRKIAQEIEYSPTTIYLYFQNKEEIINHVIKHGYHLFEHYLSSSQEHVKGADLSTKISEGLRAYVQFGLEHPDYYKLMFMQWVDIEFAGENKRLQGYHSLLELITLAVHSGVFRPTDPQFVTQSLWASVHGITSLLITFDDKRFDWSRKEELIRFHLQSILIPFQPQN